MNRLGNQLVVVALGFVLLGCGDPKLAAVKSALEDPTGDFQLFVSNQSFATNPVDVRVSIDGVPVIQKYFEVGNQHNWQKFVLKLAPGEHRILVTSRKGKATLDQTFVVEGKQSAVLDYWYYPKGDGDTPRHFSFSVGKGPIGFR